MNRHFKVDLTNCDREPIHILGAIQPIGFLVALSTDWIVARASENVRDFIGRTHQEMIGHPLADFFPSIAIHDLRNRVALLRGQDAVERIFGCELVKGAALFDVALHMSGGQIIIEAEPAAGSQGDTTAMVRSMVSRLDQAPDMTAFFREGARQIRGLLGYDRVMVYKFDPEGSG